jgi:hypothetical protein
MYKMDVEGWVQAKENVAAVIFDYEYSEGYQRLHEEDCHGIAEIILKILGFRIEEDFNDIWKSL